MIYFTNDTLKGQFEGKYAGKMSVQKKYFSMVNFKPGEKLLEDETLESQDCLLKQTILHPVSIEYPPSLSYRKHFLKSFLKELEKSDVEIHDNIYEEYARLMTVEESELCFKSYIMPSKTAVIIKESTKLISEGTTGLCTWQASKYLSEWMMENQEVIKSKHVFELGSGLGFTGLVALKSCQPRSFMFSDCHWKVLTLLADNIIRNLNEKNDSKTLDATARGHNVSQDHNCDSLNSEFEFCSVCWSLYETKNEDENTDNISTSSASQSKEEIMLSYQKSKPVVWKYNQDDRVSLSKLDWESVNEIELKRIGENIEVILAADVVYDTSIVPALVKILSILLKSKNSPVAYIASTVRNTETRNAFISALDATGVKYQKIEGPKQSWFIYDNSTPIEILKLHY